jgi:hypothetical protein
MNVTAGTRALFAHVCVYILFHILVCYLLLTRANQADVFPILARLYKPKENGNQEYTSKATILLEA